MKTQYILSAPEMEMFRKLADNMMKCWAKRGAKWRENTLNTSSANNPLAFATTYLSIMFYAFVADDFSASKKTFEGKNHSQVLNLYFGRVNMPYKWIYVRCGGSMQRQSISMLKLKCKLFGYLWFSIWIAKQRTHPHHKRARKMTSKVHFGQIVLFLTIENVRKINIFVSFQRWN